jgi:peptide/nickel transport system permease protein
MTEATPMMGDAGPPATDVARRMQRPRQSYVVSVVYGTVGRAGAKVGLIWIGIIAFCAIFSPLLANSHPLWMMSVSSPLLRYLTPTDVAIPLVTVLAVVLLFLRRLTPGMRWLVFFAATAIIIGLCIWLVRPPLTVVYDQYRQMHAQGAIKSAVYAPIPYSPTDRQRDQPQKRLIAPSGAHWLGTDENGADVASRMIHACRIALAVGFIATSIAMAIGLILGGLMGYFSGVVDLIGMRLVEIFEAIPQLFLLLTFVAFFPRNLYIMMAIIGFTSWPGYTRFIRAEFLKLRQQDFVQAAKACGLPLRSIIFRHMLPNGVAPALVTASFGVAAAILTESFLSFLGLGLVDEPSWGQMLSQAISPAGGFSWWIATFPGLAIFLTVFAYNLIGEALRDAIDPHLKKAAHL